MAARGDINRIHARPGVDRDRKPENSRLHIDDIGQRAGVDDHRRDIGNLVRGGRSVERPHNLPRRFFRAITSATLPPLTTRIPFCTDAPNTGGNWPANDTWSVPLPSVPVNP